MYELYLSSRAAGTWRGIVRLRRSLVSSLVCKCGNISGATKTRVEQRKQKRANLPPETRPSAPVPTVGVVKSNHIGKLFKLTPSFFSSPRLYSVGRPLEIFHNILDVRFSRATLLAVGLWLVGDVVTE